MPIWYGYSLASIGIVAAVLMAAIRWWQVVFLRQPVGANNG
jgi:hypothetical protein